MPGEKILNDSPFLLMPCWKQELQGPLQDLHTLPMKAAVPKGCIALHCRWLNPEALTNNDSYHLWSTGVCQVVLHDSFSQTQCPLDVLCWWAVVVPVGDHMEVAAWSVWRLLSGFHLLWPEPRVSYRSLSGTLHSSLGRRPATCRWTPFCQPPRVVQSTLTEQGPYI